MDESRFFEDLDARHSQSWPVGIATEPVFPQGPVALTASLRAWAQADPNRIAIDYYGTTIDYLELDRLSDRCAAVLAGHGVREGDRVAVVLDNCPQFFFAFYGILKLGAVHVPIDPQTGDDELAAILEDAEATAAIVNDTIAPRLLEMRSRTLLESVFSTSPAELLPLMSALSWPSDVVVMPQRCPGSHDFLAAIQAQSEPRQWADGDLDALAALNYPSGTTGVPKACMHTQRTMIQTAAAALAANGPVGLDPASGLPQREVVLDFMPLSWIFGQTVGLIYPVFVGATTVLLMRWHPVDVLSAISRCRVTRTYMPVDQLADLIRQPDRDRYVLGTLRQTHVASLNRTLTPALRRQWRAMTGGQVGEVGWGMTETHTLDTFTTGMSDDDRDLAGVPIFVGLPVPGTRIRVCDVDTGQTLPVGERGELVIHSPALFRGYWRRPEETARALRDGWFHTGDIGAYDDDGFLHYFGRYRDRLEVSGRTVFPSELEQMIGRHDAVASCAVLGRADPEHGQVPVAFVRLEAVATDPCRAAESLRDWCRERLAEDRIPEIRIVDTLPVTTTGKVKRAELAARLAADPGPRLAAT